MKECLEQCHTKAPLIAEATEQSGSWAKLSDTALHLSSSHTKGLHALSVLLAHDGSKPCLLCDNIDSPHVMTYSPPLTPFSFK